MKRVQKRLNLKTVEHEEKCDMSAPRKSSG